MSVDVVHSAGFAWLARAGFVARGLIYAIVGILAIKLALGSGGQNASQQGALKAIAHQPFGKVLLIIVAIGLAAYAMWRFVRAFLGRGPEASDTTMERVVAFASGAVYAGLCAIAVSILLGSSSSSSGGPKRATAGALGWPAGTWLVGIVGVILIAVGLYQGYRAFTKEFTKDSKTEQMSPEVKRSFEAFGVFGYLARMVVFVLVGVFLIKAAVDYNPSKAVGLDGALAKLEHASYGPGLLGLVAAGLIAFGIYSLFDARYRQI